MYLTELINLTEKSYLNPPCLSPIHIYVKGIFQFDFDKEQI